jgi:hypothetical protein
MAALTVGSPSLTVRLGVGYGTDQFLLMVQALMVQAYG